MDIEGTKRFIYWICFFIFVIILTVFMTAERLSVLFRVIIIVLLAFLSSRFRLRDLYSFISICLVILAGVFMGALISNDSIQFWLFAFLFVILFFLSSVLFERKLLEV